MDTLSKQQPTKTVLTRNRNYKPKLSTSTYSVQSLDQIEQEFKNFQANAIYIQQSSHDLVDVGHAARLAKGIINSSSVPGLSEDLHSVLYPSNPS